MYSFVSYSYMETKKSSKGEKNCKENGVWYHSYVIDGGSTYNPCGCGSNVYHLEYDGKTIFGVCNVCEKDIYEVKQSRAQDLFQIAEMTMFETALKWNDSSRGIAFVNYVNYAIRATLTRITSEDAPIRVPYDTKND